jgi:hypothetical protein
LRGATSLRCLQISLAITRRSTRSIQADGDHRVKFGRSSITSPRLSQGEGDSVLLLHGNPAWGFLYRDVVGLIVKSGDASSLRTGCQWRLLPREFPPRSTVYHYFSLWRTQGVWTRLQWAEPKGQQSTQSGPRA